MNIGFYLENISEIEKARLLIESIRDNFEHASIYVITDYDVKLEDCKIIKSKIEKHEYLLFMDKVQAASIFEQHVLAPYLWVDIDSIFLKPCNQCFKSDQSIYVKPVDIKNIGILVSENLSLIWTKTMDYLGINQFEHHVMSSISKEAIFPYYNIGMVYINDHQSLFKSTYQKINELSEKRDIKTIIESHPLNRIFYHQLVFSVMIEKIYHKRISQLENYVNYPLHLIEKDQNEIDVKLLKSIRYDTYFKNHDIPDFLKKIIKVNKSLL